MMMSFHLPPTAASAAVNGQPLTGFRRRVRPVVTAPCLLVAATSLRYDREDVTTSIMQCVTHAPAAGSGARATRRTARLRFRVRRMEGAPLAARSPAVGVHALAGL